MVDARNPGDALRGSVERIKAAQDAARQAAQEVAQVKLDAAAVPARPTPEADR